MKIGFTGTRKGMTPEQHRAVLRILKARLKYGLDETVHGDCTGSDEEFHGLCILLRVPKITIRPGLNFAGAEPTRSYCDQHSPGNGHTQITVLPPEPYLVRDEKIVATTEILIATPKGFKEELRSGTWTTVRRARKLNHTRIIVWPGGQIEVEKNP